MSALTTVALYYAVAVWTLDECIQLDTTQISGAAASPAAAASVGFVCEDFRQVLSTCSRAECASLGMHASGSRYNCSHCINFQVRYLCPGKHAALVTSQV